MVKRRIVLPALLLAALLALLVHHLATFRGLHVSPDSVQYIGSARNLMAGRGLTVPYGQLRGQAFTHWAPFLPAVLALMGRLGFDLLAGTRWLNAALFAACTFLVGYALFLGTRSFWISVLGAFLTLTSTDLLHVHSWVWTEPFFLFFGLSGFLLLAGYLDGWGTVALTGSGALLGLAFLTRYAGASAVAAGILSILLLDRRTRGRKLLSCLVFTGVSCLPMGIWLVRNCMLTERAIDRTIAFHPLGRGHAEGAYYVFSRWLFPDVLPTVLKATGVAAGALLITAVTGVLLWREMRGRSPSGERAPSRLPHVLLLFLFCYAGSLVVSISLFDYATPLNARILAPVYAAGLVAVLCLVHRGLRHLEGRRALKIVVVLVCLGFAGRYAVNAWGWLTERLVLGDYRSRHWSQSELIGYLAKFPDEAPIYSNDPDALYFYLGRSACRLIPQKLDPYKLRPCPDYLREISAMKEDLLEHGGSVAYFKTAMRAGLLPSEEELNRLLPLRCVRRSVEGAIYVVVEPSDGPP